jgi:hypothetical protein
MDLQKREGPGSPMGETEAGNDHAGWLISSEDNPPQHLGQLRDKYGNPHSEAIFKNWTPAAIRALGIYRVGDERKGGGS